jgi:hypothetical protein
MLHLPRINVLSKGYAALWESWCNPPNTATEIILFDW